MNFKALPAASATPLKPSPADDSVTPTATGPRGWIDAGSPMACKSAGEKVVRQWYWVRAPCGLDQLTWPSHVPTV